MHLSRALSALLAATALSACATSAAAPGKHATPTRTPVPESTVAPPPTDQQIAQRGMLRRADFPAEWKDTTPQGKRLVCPATTAAVKAASGFARSRTFSNGPNTELEVVSYVFTKPAGARTHYAALAKRAFPACLMRGLTKRLRRASYKIGRTVISALPLNPVGDARTGTRMTIPVSRKGVHANILFDLVVARTGRAIALELFVDAVDPFDAGFRGTLTATHVKRLHDAQLN